MDHIFLSIACSSFNMKEAEIIEIAAVRTIGLVGPINKKTSILAAFTSKVTPKKSVSSDARKIANYNEIEWKESIPFESAISAFRDTILRYDEKYVIITHLSDIVRPLLRAEVERIGKKEELFSGRAWVDVAQLAWPLTFNHMIKSRSLEALSAHFGVTLEPNQSSADNCTALLNVYNHMMRRYSTALAGEEAVREFGGETLQNIRNMIGF